MKLLVSSCKPPPPQVPEMERMRVAEQIEAASRSAAANKGRSANRAGEAQGVRLDSQDEQPPLSCGTISQPSFQATLAEAADEKEAHARAVAGGLSVAPVPGSEPSSSQAAAAAAASQAMLDRRKWWTAAILHVASSLSVADGVAAPSPGQSELTDASRVVAAVLLDRCCSSSAAACSSSGAAAGCDIAALGGRAGRGWNSGDSDGSCAPCVFNESTSLSRWDDCGDFGDCVELPSAQSAGQDGGGSSESCALERVAALAAGRVYCHLVKGSVSDVSLQEVLAALLAPVVSTPALQRAIVSESGDTAASGVKNLADVETGAALSHAQANLGHVSEALATTDAPRSARLLDSSVARLWGWTGVSLLMAHSSQHRRHGSCWVRWPSGGGGDDRGVAPSGDRLGLGLMRLPAALASCARLTGDGELLQALRRTLQHMSGRFGWQSGFR